MTNEELVMQIKGGQAALSDQLWSQVCAFAYSQAGKFYTLYADRCRNFGLEYDDLCQEAYFALEPAIEAFRGDYKFLTYFGKHLKKQFFKITKMNYNNWQNNTVHQAESIDAPAYTDNVEISLADTLASSEDVENTVVDAIFTEQLGRDLQEAITPLLSSWQEVITSVYFFGIRPAELARRQGCTKATVGRKHRRALEVMREAPSMQKYLCLRS